MLFCGQVRRPSPVEPLAMEAAGGTCKAPDSSSDQNGQLGNQNSALPARGFTWELGKTHKNYLKVDVIARVPPALGIIGNRPSL